MFQRQNLAKKIKLPLKCESKKLNPAVKVNLNSNSQFLITHVRVQIIYLNSNHAKVTKIMVG